VNEIHRNAVVSYEKTRLASYPLGNYVVEKMLLKDYLFPLFSCTIMRYSDKRKSIEETEI